MGTLNKRKIHGFPAWQDTELGGIFKSVECTSSANITAAGGQMIGTGQTFDATGMYSNGAGGWKFQSVAAIADLLNHGHITMWVDPALVSRLNDSNQYALWLGLGNTYLQRTPSAGFGAIFPRFGTPAADAVLSSSDYREWPVRLDINFVGGPTNGYVDFYIDYCLCYRSPKITWDTSRLSFFTNSGGAFGPATTSGALYRVQLGNKSIILPYAPLNKGFAIFGDSISLQGGRQAKAPYEFGTTATGIKGDQGWVMQLVRHCGKDFGQIARVMNFAITGTSSANLPAQVTACFTTKNWKPPYSIVMMGANDTSGSVTKAAYKTNMSAFFSSVLDTWGQERVFAIKPISVGADTGKTAPQIALIPTYGDALDELAAADSRITVVDGYGALGGEAYVNDGTYWPAPASGSLHPLQRGQRLLGDTVVGKLRQYGL